MVEPLASFYKDEVRMVGRELGLSSSMLDRHPFPGPGLAIRCLCANDAEAPQRALEAVGSCRFVPWGCRGIQDPTGQPWRFTISRIRTKRRPTW